MSQIRKKQKNESKITTILGAVIVGFLIFGAARTVYKRTMEDPIKVTQKPDKNLEKEIANVLFWYEQELEKTTPGSVGAQLKAEESRFVTPLFDSLQQLGLSTEYITTMTQKATDRLIELNAYRGSEPDVWLLAAKGKYDYIFKVDIMESQDKSNKLQSMVYNWALYKANNQELIWQGETTRLNGFLFGLGGFNPDTEKLLKSLQTNWQAIGAIQ